MGTSRSMAGILAGLAATAGAFGAAATMSAATAHADDFTDVLASVQGDYTAGSTAFTTAFTDFGAANGLTSGLAQLFDGIDDYTVAAPQNLLVGTIDVATGQAVISPLEFELLLPTDASNGLSIAEGLFSQGEGYFTQAATDLASGGYAESAYLDALGFEYTAVAPLQELLLGAVASIDPGAIVY